MRPLAALAVGFVVVASFQVHPAPGAHGAHLAVSLSLIALAAATVAVVRSPVAAARLQLPAMIVIVLSAAALVGLQPNGPGFLGVFPGVAAAALRLPARAGAAVAATAMAALAVAWASSGHHPVTGAVFNEIGVVAFFLIATFARQLREANERSRQLIAELETSRAAQAEAAVLGERQRLAREMHDVLAHTLSGLVLNLEGARLLAERDHGNPNMTEVVGRAHRLAKTGLEDARRAIGMLRDETLPSPERLGELAAEFQADTGVACAFTTLGEPRHLASDSQLTLYRVAQEALTNVRKHASPERVDMRLAYHPDEVCLTIEDHQTSEPSASPGGGTGYGITGMRERAELLGGSLTAGPTEAGFRVEVRIPR